VTSSFHQLGHHTLAFKENSNKTSVIYNANRPFFNFETHHYDRYACQAGLPIEFDDLNSARTRWGLDADTAAKCL
jgi:hypothetical protein